MILRLLDEVDGVLGWLAPALHLARHDLKLFGGELRNGGKDHRLLHVQVRGEDLVQCLGGMLQLACQRRQRLGLPAESSAHCAQIGYRPCHAMAVKVTVSARCRCEEKTW